MRLTYRFDCLDGRCLFQADDKDGLIAYGFETDIAELDNVSGQLNDQDSEKFRQELARAGIERWDREYQPVLSAIEDAVKWEVEYEKDGKVYCSKGEETYEPYDYFHLVDALALCSPKADYFRI